MMRVVLVELGRLPPRTLRLALYGGLLVVATIAWVTLLKQPTVQYRQARTTRASLERVVAATPDLSPQIEALRADVKALDERLHGSIGASALEGRRGTALMAEIARAAERSGVALTAIEPVGTLANGPFAGDQYALQATGRYAALVAWLRELERALPTLALQELSLKSGDPDLPLALAARVVVYRPAPAGGSPAEARR
jgi:Tfp pilus assembly protein PilO